MKRINNPASVTDVAEIGSRAYVTSWCNETQSSVQFECDVDDAPEVGDVVRVTVEWAQRKERG